MLEEEAIKRAEEDLKLQLQAEQLNKEAEAELLKIQAEAVARAEKAKLDLERSGAEFVSNEEFERIKAAQKSAKAPPAA